MNIQGVVQQLNNIISSIQNSEAGKAAAPAADAGQAAVVRETPADIKMVGQEAVNVLLKELSDKLGSAQKALDSMPQSLKDAIRQLFADNTSVGDLGGGVANLLQGQKDVAGNLHKLAETLSAIAEFLSETAPEETAAQGIKQKFPQLPGMPVTKEAVAEKLDAQLIKSLLESIAGKDSAAIVKQLQTLGQNDETAEDAAPQEAKPAVTGEREAAAQGAKPAAENTAKPLPGEIAPQQGKTANQEQAAGKTPDKQPSNQETAKTGDGAGAAQGKAAAAPPREGTTINNQTLRQQAPVQEKGLFKDEGVSPATKNPALDFFRNATVVKGLSEIAGKDVLAELVNVLKEAAAGEGEPQKPAAPDADRQAAKQQNESTVLKEGESLLSLARGNLAAPKLLPEIKPQDVARLMETVQKLGSEIEKELMQKPELARAWQTLSSRPDDLSGGEKAVLHSFLANIIKDTVKNPKDFSLLERAMSKLAGKAGVFSDNEMSEMEAFGKLLKNSESLHYSRQQVETWANSLRDIAAGLARTTQMPGEKGQQHIQSSFVLYLAPDGQEKNQPVYINIYHEKEGSNSAGEKSAETWLRVNATPEYTGLVTAIFHLYQKNLLDVRVVFENPDGMKEFSRFVPDIAQALKMTDMKLNSILVV